MDHLTCGLCCKLRELTSCVEQELRRHAASANVNIHCSDCLICAAIVSQSAAITIALLQHVHDGCETARRDDHEQAISARATTEPAPRADGDGAESEGLVSTIGNDNGPGILSPAPIPIVTPCCVCGRDSATRINGSDYCPRHCQLRSVRGMKVPE